MCSLDASGRRRVRQDTNCSWCLPAMLMLPALLCGGLWSLILWCVVVLWCWAGGTMVSPVSPAPINCFTTELCQATMADSDSSDVEFLEARKAAASAAEPNAERSDGGVVGTKPSKKRRKAPGPPPRLAWGAGSAIGGGGAGGAGGTFSRRSSGDSYGSREDAPRKKRAAPPLDDDDDGLWDDDDDDLVIPTRDATMTSAVASKSSGKAKSSKGGGIGSTKRNAKKSSNSSSSSSGGGISDLMGAPAALAASSSSTTAEAAMMWVDRYAPQTSADLCVAPKKVKEIREWMIQASDKTISSDPFTAGNGGGGIGNFGMQYQQPHAAMPPTPGGEPVPQILILVGSPGVGKSTAIRVLASEMGWTVHQWNDAQQDTPSGGARYGRGSFDSAMSVRYQSQMSSFEEFLAAAGTGYTALDFGGDGSSDIGKSEPLLFKAGKKRKASASKAKVKASTIDDDRAASSKSTGSIILVEDIPNLYNPDAEATFRTIMAQHIHKSQTPTVLIFSDVSEGKHRPADLERLIEPSILYSPLARICQIHGVAKPKMKKCLQVIVKKEQLRGTSDLLFEELHATSKGDMRHAIMALQFQYASAGGSRALGGRANIEYNERERDTKLSMFRALGKLLYAKRQKIGANDEEYIRKSSSWNSILPGHLYDSRPPLEFVPEDVMSTGDIDHKNAVSFLQYHCPEFFTDEIELSTAFDHFSDAALFLDREYSVSRDRSDSIFPLEYVSSIAGRAVANANKNPAPNHFRQLSTPKVNDVMRKKRGNDISMLQLCQRLSCGGGDVLSLGANIGSTNHFVVDTLPYMRNIVPGEVDYALSNMYSYARPIDKDNPSIKMDSATLLRKHLEKQNEILADDDIADDDSDDDDAKKDKGQQPAIARSTSSSARASMPPTATCVNMPNVQGLNVMGTNIMEQKMPAHGQPQKSVQFASNAPAPDVIVID